MSDGSLSQDEIDALLQGSGGMEFDEAPAAPAQEESLSSQDRKAFQRLVAETVDGQASNFSMLVSKSVTIGKPTVDTTDSSGLEDDLEGDVVQVRMDLSEGVTGPHSYVLASSGAAVIAGAMMGQEDAELDDAALNALQEAFSQVGSPLLTAIGDKTGETVMTDAPEAAQQDKGSLQLPGGEFVKVTYPVTIEDGASFELVEIFGAEVAADILDRAGLRAKAAAPRAPQGRSAQSQPSGGAPASGMGGQGAFGNAMAGGGFGGPPGGMASQQASPVQFPNLQQSSLQPEQGNISLLMDVYMEMTVELGRTKKLIKEILGMGEGTIIELDKLAGEPVDILVNHKLIAKGEVVVIDENFGVRVTEIVSPMERMNNMT